MDQNICYRWYVGRLLFKYIFGGRYVPPPLSPHHSPQVGTRRGRRVRTQQEDGQSWPMPRHLKLDFLNTSKYSQIQAVTTNTNTNTIDSINMWRADKCQAIWNWIFQMRAKIAKYRQVQANTAKYSQIQPNTSKYRHEQLIQIQIQDKFWSGIWDCTLVPILKLNFVRILRHYFGPDLKTEVGQSTQLLSGFCLWLCLRCGKWSIQGCDIYCLDTNITGQWTNKWIRHISIRKYKYFYLGVVHI